MSRLWLVALAVGGCHTFNLPGQGWTCLCDRPELVESPVEEVVIQRDRGPVDVLWVVDDSPSMADVRAALVEDAGSLMVPALEGGADWHVGVVTASAADPDTAGLLRTLPSGHRFLAADTPAPVARLAELLALPGDGGGDSGLGAVLAVLDPSPAIAAANAGFRRPGAPLHVVIVADSDESAEVTVDDLRAALGPVEATPELVVSVVVGDDACGAAAPRYVDAAEATGGVVASLCEAGWLDVEAGVRPDAGVLHAFHLRRVPTPGTLSVWVRTDGWDWEGIERVDGQDWLSECQARGASSCFEYVYDLVGNAVVPVTAVPGPFAEVHLRYLPLETGGPACDRSTADCGSRPE